MAEVLRRCPAVKHIGLASGHDIPVRIVRWGPGRLVMHVHHQL